MPSTHGSDWLNYSFPTGTVNVTPANGEYELFSAFTVSEALYIDRVAWYRPATSGATKPAGIDLWRADSQVLVASARSLVDDGAIGWQDTALAAPVALYPGVRYKLAIVSASGSFDPSTTPGSFPTTGLGFAWSTIVTGYNGGGTGYPGTDATNSVFRGVDVRRQPGTTPPATDPVADLGNALAAWFDPSDATRPLSAPKKYPDAIYALHSKVDADGVTWDAKLGPLQVYGGVTSQGISAGLEIVRTAVANVQSAVTALPAGATPAAVAAVQAAVDALAEAMTGNFAVIAGEILRTGALDGTDWTSIAAVDFSGPVNYAVPADLYIITLTTLPERAVTEVLDGEVFARRSGWWAPRRGGAFGPRQYMDYLGNVAEWNGHRMDGCLIWVPPGYFGNVQAYLRS